MGYCRVVFKCIICVCIGTYILTVGCVCVSEFEVDMGGGAEAVRLVNRLKNTNLEKFHSLCKMHLSFLLDLPGTALEDFLGDCPPEQTPDKSRSIFNFGKRKAPKGKPDLLSCLYDLR